MVRKKLLIDKVFDGEVEFFCGTRYESIFLEMVEAQKFVFSQAALCDVIDATVGFEGLSSLWRAPYDTAWVEAEQGNRGWITLFGDISTLERRLGMPNLAEEFPYPDECRDAIVAVIPVTGITGRKNEYQVFPAAMLQCTVKNPITGKVPMMVVVHKEDQELLTRDEMLWVREVGSIPLAGWAILNVKNAATTEQADVPETLAASRKKRGKPPLHGYTFVDSNMRNAQKVGSSTGASRAAHMVRGHFKNRKSGVYWWNAHVAGKGAVKERDAYIVKG